MFQGYGVEIEYMVVDAESREIRSIVDTLLDDLERSPDASTRTEGNPSGRVEWSNELAAHVAEAKCAEPEPSLEGWLAPLNASVDHVNTLLAPRRACLIRGPRGQVCQNAVLDFSRRFSGERNGDEAFGVVAAVQRQQPQETQGELVGFSRSGGSGDQHVGQGRHLRKAGGR